MMKQLKEKQLQFVHRYRHPDSCSQYEEAEWAALLEMSRNDARRSPLPDSLLSPALPVTPHQFKEGMLIETVHPLKPMSIHVAKISHVSEESKFFKVTIEGKNQEEGLTWTTSMDDPAILPIRFCEKNEEVVVPPIDWVGGGKFNWDDYLLQSSSSDITCAEDGIFPERRDAEDLGFEAGFRLESVNPEVGDQICVATVLKVSGHLLHVQLDSESDSEPLIVAATFEDLFPTGWSQSNNYPLQIPPEYSPNNRITEDANSVSSLN